METSDSKRRRSLHDAAFKLRVVRTAIQKELTGKEVSDTFGIAPSNYWSWKKLYDEGGPEALRDSVSRPRSKEPKPPDPAKEELKQQVADVKKQFPYFGIERVWHWLRRMFFLPVSQSEVRTAMKEADLVQPPPKRKRRPPKPRGFNVPKPNQLWCSDITSFTIGRGLMVHVIGFIDAHSRYLVSWGVYAAATSELVLEVLKRGFDTYGYPTAVLTDNGTQYKVRRGKTNFQKLMLREDINHLSTRPRNPQGNGLIEAFWGTMKKEFVAEARLGAIEDVRERLGHWINFYNWQRPHTEMGGATPAEKYFQFAEEARREIEKRIQENEKELAFGRTARAIGQASAGARPVEVTKEGEAFVVKLGGKEIKRTTLDPKKKEKKHEPTQSGAAGAGGRDEQRSEGEGGGGARGALGGEANRGGVPRDRAQADPVLQAREQDGRGDGDGGSDAGDSRTQAQSAGGGDDASSEDGGDPAGAPAAPKPPPSDPQTGQAAKALPEGSRETSEGGPSSDGSAPEAGPASVDDPGPDTVDHG